MFRLFTLCLSVICAGSLTAQVLDCPPVTEVPTGREDFTLAPLATFATGVFDEGAAEIVAYDAGSQRLAFTNANANAITILDISDALNPTVVAEVSPMTDELGGVNSVAISNGRIAAAYQGAGVDAPGQVIVLDMDGNETARYPAGVLPDMITFSPDGNLILTANEGQPNDEYDVDPEGSVTVIDLTPGQSPTDTTISLSVFNGRLGRLAAAGIRVFGPNASVGQDLEPEYISIIGDQAYVGLQENNAYAILDLTTLTFTDIIPFGYKDLECPGNALDPSNRDDGINFRNANVLGMLQPDAIECVTINGEAYLLTANEGDARDYDGFSEEVRISDLELDTLAYPDAESLRADENFGRLRVTNAYGDVDCDGDIDQIYAYGGRSFSIFRPDGTLVFDSGDQFERIVARDLPEAFNSNNDENDSADSRSDDKGPEPEAIEVFVRNGVTYAAIGLERVGGVMVYDISDPTAPQYVTYTNNRDFGVDAQLEDDRPNPAAGDLGVEDIVFIPAASSPTGEDLLVTANEISGTITLFGFAPANAAPLTLRLLHNNDGESKIIPGALDDGTSFGGAARFTAILDSLRMETLTSVTLSSGDNYLPGSAFDASRVRPAGSFLYDSEVLNLIGYDALAIGNHEFDFGPETLARIVTETSASGATFVSANLDFSGEPELQALVDAGRIARRTVIDRDGQQIGVVGLTTPLLPTISSPRNVTVAADVARAAQQEVDALLADGVNKIILVSHLQGLDAELDLAGMLNGVDVIIAGGGDELLSNDPANALGGLEITDEYPIRTTDATGRTVYVVTTPGEYRYVGNLIIDFDAFGNVAAIDDESDVIPVLGDANVSADVAAIADSIGNFIEELENNIIAVTEVDLDGLRSSLRTMETNQGNLVTDAYLWFYDRQAEDFDLPTDVPVVAVQNGGGMRDDEVIPAGSNISEQKTIDILLFANAVTVLEGLSPDSLKAVLENSVSRFPGQSGGFLQIAGFEFVFDSSAAPGNRVVSVTLDDETALVVEGEVVDGAPDVFVVTNGFTAAGGDGYGEFVELERTNIGPSYQRVLFDYLVAEDGLDGVITAERYPVGGENRIQELTTVSTDDNLNLEEYDWNTLPNPFSDQLNFTFELPQTQTMSLLVLDAQGRTVNTVMDSRTLIAGDQTVTADLANLPSGIYYVSIRIGGRVATLPVIKQ